MRFACLCILAALVVDVVPARTADDSDVPPKISKLLGDHVVELLQSASRVEVYRIKPEQSKAEENVSGYPIVATGKEKGKDFAKKLTAVLFNEKTYFGERAICFTPGVVFRIWGGKELDKESVDVIICFHCSALHLVARDERKKDLRHVDGAFGPDIRSLLALAKEAFPDDPDIQAIK